MSEGNTLSRADGDVPECRRSSRGASEGRARFPGAPEAFRRWFFVGLVAIGVYMAARAAGKL
jgi:hypothetical protein